MTVQLTELDGNRNGSAAKAKSGVREEGVVNQWWESCARKKRKECNTLDPPCGHSGC